MVISNPWCSWFHGCSLFAEADSFEVMKQNKLGTFDLTQIAGGPLGNFAQQAPKLGRDGLLWKWLKWYYIYIFVYMIWYMFLLCYHLYMFYHVYNDLEIDILVGCTLSAGVTRYQTPFGFLTSNFHCDDWTGEGPSKEVLVQEQASIGWQLPGGKWPCWRVLTSWRALTFAIVWDCGWKKRGYVMVRRSGFKVQNLDRCTRCMYHVCFCVHLIGLIWFGLLKPTDLTVTL